MKLLRALIYSGISLFVLLTSASALAQQRIPMYAMYHPTYIDWFYTTSATQRSDALNFYGYYDYGVYFYVDETSIGGGLPFMRFFKGSPELDHFYTIDVSESSYVQSLGWFQEGTEGFLHPTQVNGSVPVYRASFWDAGTGDLVHHYTTDWNVIVTLQTNGWSYDGLAGYGFAQSGISPSHKIPVLAYHGGNVGGCTDYQTNHHYALQKDLEMFRDNGFTVVPVRWILEWALGTRAGSTMPSKPVGITVDDGHPLDWTDSSGRSDCSYVKSMANTLSDFKNSYPAVFAGTPHATSFVIASPKVRNDFIPYLTDTWWSAAQASGVIDIQNHGTDHDHTAIIGPVTDSAMGGITLAIGGLIDSNWSGAGNFCRIGMDSSKTTAINQVVKSADYIQSKTGVRPDIFATPYAGLSSGLHSYWQNYASTHGHYAAFGNSGGYVVQNSSQTKYNFLRFIKGCDYQSQSDLLHILSGAGRPSHITTTCHPTCS